MAAYFNGQLHALSVSISADNVCMFLGHKLESLGSQGKKLFAISMTQPEGPTINLAASDQVDYTRWFMALENASRADTDQQQPSTRQTRVSEGERERERKRKRWERKGGGGEYILCKKGNRAYMYIYVHVLSSDQY